MVYFFKGIAMTQWAKRLGMYGRIVTLVTIAESEEEAARNISRTLLRPLQHKRDRFVQPDASMAGSGSFSPTGVGVLVDGTYLPAELSSLAIHHERQGQ